MHVVKDHKNETRMLLCSTSKYNQFPQTIDILNVLRTFLLPSDERSFSLAKPKNRRSYMKIWVHGVDLCIVFSKTHTHTHNTKIFLAKYHAHFISFCFRFGVCFVICCNFKIAMNSVHWFFFCFLFVFFFFFWLLALLLLSIFPFVCDVKSNFNELAEQCSVAHSLCIRLTYIWNGKILPRHCWFIVGNKFESPIRANDESTTKEKKIFLIAQNMSDSCDLNIFTKNLCQILAVSLFVNATTQIHSASFCVWCIW